MRDPAKQVVGKRRRLRRKNRRIRSLRERLPSVRQVGAFLWRGIRRGVRVYVAVGIVGVSAGLSYFGFWWLTTTGQFAIETVDVRGNAQRDDAFVQGLAGVERGDNLFALDLTGVARRIEEDPWIASAEVERVLPHGLAIEVVEREPAALVELGGLYLADADGMVFKRADVARGEGDGLPVITGLSRDEYVADEAAGAAAIRAAIDVARRYADGDRPALSEVHVSARGIALRTYETALAVRLGDAVGDEVARRLAAFDAAWSALDDDERAVARVIYLDNETNPDRVTVGF